jgi:hypothetical protein
VFFDEKNTASDPKQQVIDSTKAIYHEETIQNEIPATLNQISPDPRTEEEPFFKAFTKESRYHLNETTWSRPRKPNLTPPKVFRVQYRKKATDRNSL